MFNFIKLFTMTVLHKAKSSFKYFLAIDLGFITHAATVADELEKS
jgi:hypothetical protein